MWHRDPAKYDEFPGQDNIIVGNGELIMVRTPRGIGWITLCHHVIYDRKDALIYAAKLDRLINFNRQRVAKLKVKYS